MPKPRQLQFFEASKMTLPEAMDESIASLNEYGSRYDHWVITFSGGKDSTATVSFIHYALKNGLVKHPKSVTVLMSNTGIELIPLLEGAKKVLDKCEQDGFKTMVVEPKLDDNVFVALLGRGLPPFNSGRRTCTRMLKSDPMDFAVKQLQDVDNTLFLTGIRFGESRSRDDRIAVSCSKDSGECGQGWFQNSFNQYGYASLSPIVHWRVCNVFDWLYFEQDKHKFPVDGLLQIYGEDDIRTGCMACFLVEQDKPLLKVSRLNEWKHLRPILKLYDVYDFLNSHTNRLKKPLSYNKNGSLSKKSGVVGPTTIKARQKAFEMVMKIQELSGVILITSEQEDRIRWHWKNKTFPKGWKGNEPVATLPQQKLKVIKGTETVAVQENLL